MKKTAIYVTLGVIALFAVIIFSMNISYGNSKIDKKTLVLAQQDKCKAEL